MNKTIVLIILVLLSGCAHVVSPPPAVSQDKRIHISSAVSDTGVTGMAATANIVTFKVIDPKTGKSEEREVVYVTHSTPLGRELVTVGLGAITPALIYRNAIMNAGLVKLPFPARPMCFAFSRVVCSPVSRKSSLK